MFRAEVMGSMLRPSYLKEARPHSRRPDAPIARDLKRIEDRAVDQVIAIEEGTGVEVVTDGEMRRFLFMGPITETSRASSRSRTARDAVGAAAGDIEWAPPAAVT